jgi:hypothetical protein
VLVTSRSQLAALIAIEGAYVLEGRDASRSRSAMRNTDERWPASLRVGVIAHSGAIGQSLAAPRRRG